MGSFELTGGAAAMLERNSRPRPLNEFKVNTGFSKDAVISTIEHHTDLDVSVISRQILNLREEGIRKALIELGWKPPKEDEGESDK